MKVEIATQQQGRPSHKVKEKRQCMRRQSHRRSTKLLLQPTEANLERQEIPAELNLLIQPRGFQAVTGLNRKLKWQAGALIDMYTHEHEIRRALTLASRKDPGAAVAIETATAMVIREARRKGPATKKNSKAGEPMKPRSKREMKGDEGHKLRKLMSTDPAKRPTAQSCCLNYTKKSEAKRS